MALIVLNGIQGVSIPTAGDITPLSNLGSLADVNISSVQDNQVLAYNSATSEWQNTTPDSGITELVQDLSPQLGGNLDLNSKDIVGTGAIGITSTSFHSLSRRTNNDNNTTLVLFKDTSGVGESLLAKSGVGLATRNSTTSAQLGILYGEKLDSGVSKQVTLGMYTDDGSNRQDFLRCFRDASGVDTVNFLKPVTNLSTTTTLNVLIDRINTTQPNSVRMVTSLPNSVDIVNFFTSVMDYSTTSLPVQTQATFTFLVADPANPAGRIAGRLVNTYNDSTGETKMELRANDITADVHSDLGVTRNHAYSTVPFRFPSISLSSYTGTALPGMTLLDTDDNTLKCYAGGTWNALF